MKVIVTLLTFVLYSWNAYTQTDSELEKQILQYDTEFWEGYNSCDSSKMEKYLSNNVEFYHDKGGILLGSKNLTESIQKNLCSNRDFKIRRALISNSLKWFPLKKDNIVYGALLTGEHYFYVTENNNKETLNGKANFSHLWLLENKEWKMAKIISYNHGPAQ